MDCEIAVQLDSQCSGQYILSALVSNGDCALYLEKVSEHFTVVISSICKRFLNFQNINFVFNGLARAYLSLLIGVVFIEE